MSQTTSPTPRRSAGTAGTETRRAPSVAAHSAGFSSTRTIRRVGLTAVAGLVTLGAATSSAQGFIGNTDSGTDAALAAAALTVPATESAPAEPAPVEEVPVEEAAPVEEEVVEEAPAEEKTAEPGTSYAAVALNVRAAADAESERVTTLKLGAEVSTTGVTSGDWTQIKHNDVERWVATRHLTATKPEVPDTSSRTASTSRSASRDGASVDTSNLSAQRATIVNAAYKGIGGSYVYGGTAFGAWDCSGFVKWATSQAGLNLPRTAAAQAASLTKTSNPQPGDLVLQNGGGHIGIYVGDGMMISALNERSGTKLHSVDWMPVTGYYTYN